MFCAECGSTVSDTRSCGHCGADLESQAGDGGDAPSEPPPAAPRPDPFKARQPVEEAPQKEVPATAPDPITDSTPGKGEEGAAASAIDAPAEQEAEAGDSEVANEPIPIGGPPMLRSDDTASTAVESDPLQAEVQRQQATIDQLLQQQSAWLDVIRAPFRPKLRHSKR